MKRILLSNGIISTMIFSSFGQNSKTGKEAAAHADFEKVVAVVETKDFVIIVDSYEPEGGNFQTNTDNSNFMSYEKELVYMQVRGFDINAKIIISLKKTAGIYADVIITPVKGDKSAFPEKLYPGPNRTISRGPVKFNQTSCLRIQC